MPLKNKYSAICNELKSRIANGFYSSKLPPRRQLMLEFNVSSRTLHKVFCELKLSGLIAPTPGGTAVTPVAYNKNTQPKLVLVAPDPGDFTGIYPITKRLMQLAGQDGFQLIKYLKDPRKSPAAVGFFQSLGLTANDGVIFTNSTFSPEAGDYLKQHCIPFVSGNRPCAGVEINWVDWNHLELFDDVLSQLVSRGARFIDFFIPDCAARAMNNRQQVMADFRAAKKSYMLYQPELDELNMDSIDSLAEYADFLSRLHHKLDAVCISGERENLSEALRQRNLTHTRVISFGTESDAYAPEDMHCLYSEQACFRLAGKIWQLLKYVRHHPNAPPRGVKQHSEVKYSKEFKKIKFDHTDRRMFL
ncbi:MAG: hypothetical protein E7047_07250 [Lentisphaerae bacterium]|nr:hypothetical protein [Lentisphaerota bacterium]